MTRFVRTVYRLLRESLMAHAARTLLTLLGIVISVAAIMVVVTLGDSVKEYVLNEIRAFGSTTIQVEVKVPSTGHMSSDNAGNQAMGVTITTLTLEDAQAIAKLPGVEAYTVGLIGQKDVVANGKKARALLMGATADTQRVDTQVRIAHGAFFDQSDVDSTTPSAVLGAKIATKLFGDAAATAVGTRMRIGSSVYTITGVLAERGAVFGFSFDDLIYLPITTMQKTVLGVDYVQYITVRAKEGESVARVAEDIAALLRWRHHTTPESEDFAVSTITEAQDTFESVLGSITILLGLLAAISLVVGGVGIMNVMLVAVEERMREIGLRRALGARQRDIRAQFLWEAMVIALSGGVMGMLIGAIVIVSARWWIAYADLGIPLEFVARAPLLGVGFSIVAGVIFGYYPARRAAMIEPMAAIRN